MNIYPSLSGVNPTTKWPVLLSSTTWVALMSTPGWAQDSSVLQEIVVTATRQEQVLSKVPISVSAFSQAQMDAQGLKEVDDLVRFTPGLNLDRSVTGANTIAIRGISSGAGSGTTGVYIDDAPIQVRNLGFGSGTTFPGFFDLERVEVLRGPQGTLFGAGSEGGTIRFIQTEPSLTDFRTYARGEIAGTRNGEPTYEGGVAVGGPIIADRLGFRMSAFYRREGGYIDGVDGDFTVLDPTGASYGDSVSFTQTRMVREDTNWNRTVAFRAALKFAATETLTITPSVSYQKQHVNDGFGGYWLATSDEGSRDYSRPVYFAGDPASDPSLTAMDVPETEFGDDEFYLPALAINWQLGDLELVSNTSYFDRDAVQWFDYTRGYLQFYMTELFAEGGPMSNGGGVYPLAGRKSMSVYDNGQKNFVQELRLQSTDSDARLTWVAGAFYARNEQTASQYITANFMANSPYIGFAPDFAGYTDGSPFGPGSSALENFLGMPLLSNSRIYTANWQTIEEQLAGYAQGDFKVTEQLKLTVGLRVSQNDLKYTAAFGGPETNGNAPFGLPCLPGTFCENPEDFVAPGTYPVGTGPFAPVFPSSKADTSESAVTPKFGISYTLDDNNMLYATAAKGFRPGGASLKVPTVCNPELVDFGYADASGTPQQAEVYDSDSVWSYEVGTKNRLFGGRVVLDASIYHIEWSNIQASVFLPNCAYDFVDNLADATSEGIDLGFQASPGYGLTLSGAIGYNKSTFDSDATSPGGVVIYRQDASIPDVGAPWTISLSGQYDFTLFGGRDLYVRADYTHTSEQRRYGNLDPVAPNYNPLLRPVPKYSVVNARLGMEMAGADVSLFVDNLTDEGPNLNLAGGGFYDPQDWTNNTLRPRTYGLTVSFRY